MSILRTVGLTLKTLLPSVRLVDLRLGFHSHFLPERDAPPDGLYNLVYHSFPLPIPPIYLPANSRKSQPNGQSTTTIPRNQEFLLAQCLQGRLGNGV